MCFPPLQMISGFCHVFFPHKTSHEPVEHLLWDNSYEHMSTIDWTHIPKNMDTKNDELTFESVGKILQSDHYML